MNEITNQLVEKINRLENLWRPTKDGGNPALATKEIDGLISLAKAHINQSEKEKTFLFGELDKMKKEAIKQEYHIKALESKQRPDEDMKARVKHAIEILSPITMVKIKVENPQVEKSILVKPIPQQKASEVDEMVEASKRYHEKIVEATNPEEETPTYDKYEELLAQEFAGQKASEQTTKQKIKSVLPKLSWYEAKHVFDRFFKKAEKKGSGYVYEFNKR